MSTWGKRLAAAAVIAATVGAVSAGAWQVVRRIPIVQVTGATDSALDVPNGGIAQGGSTLISAAGDLRDDLVGTPELKLASGSSTGAETRDVVIPEATFWPRITGTCTFEGAEARCFFRLRNPNRVPGGRMGGRQLPRLVMGCRCNGPEQYPGHGGGFVLPPGNGGATGVTSLVGDLWVTDGSSPDSIWRIDPDDPSSTAGDYGEYSLPSGIGDINGVAGHDGDLWVIELGIPASIWRIDPDDPSSTAGDYGEYSLPAGLRNPTGVEYFDDGFWVVGGSSADEIWRIDPDDPSSTAGDYGEYSLPVGIGSASGVVAINGVLWVTAIGSPDSIWRIDPDDPSSTAGDYGEYSLPAEIGIPDGIGVLLPPISTLSWLYVTASDNPAVWVRVETTGEVVGVWQAEDAPDGAPIRIGPLEHTTDAIVDAGPPPLDVLMKLYVGEDAALDALQAYLVGRGWIDALTAVGDVARRPFDRMRNSGRRLRAGRAPARAPGASGRCGSGRGAVGHGARPHQPGGRVVGRAVSGAARRVARRQPPPDAVRLGAGQARPRPTCDTRRRAVFQ